MRLPTTRPWYVDELETCTVADFVTSRSIVTKYLFVLSHTPHEIRLTSPEKFQLKLKEELTNPVTVCPLYFDINWVWVVATKVS